jgi:hypothetical protein
MSSARFGLYRLRREDSQQLVRFSIESALAERVGFECIVVRNFKSLAETLGT